MITPTEEIVFKGRNKKTHEYTPKSKSSFHSHVDLYFEGFHDANKLIKGKGRALPTQIWVSM